MKSKVVLPAVAAAALAGLVAFVQPWESGNKKYLTPYQDVVGVWTVCDGVTGPAARPDKTYTVEQCDALSTDEIARHLRGVAVCIHQPLRENEWIAVGSWAYNVGVQAACQSTLVKLINAARPPADWCRQLLRWNRAGGREVRGLTIRRQAEYQVCIGG